MKLDRRTFVVGAGSTLAVAGLTSSAGANVSIPVEIANVYPVEEVVILENTGDEDIDLGGYVIDWEHEGDQDQTDSIPQGTTIGAGQSLSVWSGFQSEQVPPIEADVRLGEYGNGRINDSESDVIALLTSGGDVVDGTEETVGDSPGYDPDEYADDDGTGDDVEDESEEDSESGSDVDDQPEGEPDEVEESDEHEEESEDDGRDDETDTEDDDCPDEETDTETKGEKKSEDCPEEEPEPEPEDC